MENYLKLFKTSAEYEAAVEKPVVSHIVEEVDVKVKPIDPYCGHEYVEIGGLKWATMNIGANSVTDYGLYFQWGDTQGYTASQIGSGSGKKYFYWNDYKFGGDAGTAPSKYNNTDGKTVLDVEDDAAVANWGCAWRMPTANDFLNLSGAVNTTWVTNYNGTGVAGLICTSKNDSSVQLFFPAGGICDRGSINSVNGWARYWSSSLSHQGSGIDAMFGKPYNDWGINTFVCYGVNIRPVAE